jgi:hypothetical protein
MGVTGFIERMVTGTRTRLVRLASRSFFVNLLPSHGRKEEKFWSFKVYGEH